MSFLNKVITLKILFSILILSILSFGCYSQTDNDFIYRGFIRNRLIYNGFNTSSLLYNLNKDEVNERYYNLNYNLFLKKNMDNARFILDIEGKSSMLESAETEIKVNESYFSYYLGNLKLFGGKQRLDWSNGIAWNPADLINPEKDPLDPKENREGSTLGGLNYSLGRLMLTGIYQFKSNDFKSDMIHLKIKRNIFDLETSLYFSDEYQSGNITFGGMGSIFLTKDLEFHFETATSKGRDQIIPVQLPIAGINPPQFFQAFMSDTTKDNKYITSFLTGFRYTFLKQNAFFIIEYYRNDQGYDENENSMYASYLETVVGKPTQSSSDSAYLSTSNMINSKNYNKNYIYLSFQKTNKKESWRYGIDNIINIGKTSSTVIIPRIEHIHSGKLSFEAKYYWFLGDSKTEFGGKITNNIFMFNTNLYF
jgi:hypothetical protein